MIVWHWHGDCGEQWLFADGGVLHPRPSRFLDTTCQQQAHQRIHQSMGTVVVDVPESTGMVSGPWMVDGENFEHTLPRVRIDSRYLGDGDSKCEEIG